MTPHTIIHHYPGYVLTVKRLGPYPDGFWELERVTEHEFSNATITPVARGRAPSMDEALAEGQDAVVKASKE